MKNPLFNFLMLMSFIYDELIYSIFLNDVSKTGVYYMFESSVRWK